ncbi:FecR family protein [Chitinophaga sp. GCM10012297]|uniref:FecR domain-containing protein n=1 Tax=Chitinophaga chungangae TaxID=2821488 RepID=A0ABS3YH84_9BACT|nr:FecR domain-containing protein [Chitinophaga chungangae]MBO9154055.1 FecR domain-containing protein [Chitinophaga chungangae]
MNEHYQTPEDFLGDESFIAWRRGTDRTQARRWEAWMAGNPANKAVAEEAVSMLSLLETEELHPASAHTFQARDRLMSALNGVKTVPLYRRRAFRWAAAAAAVVIFAVVLLRPREPVVYATAPGETKSFILPDGTSVTLNASSSLKLAGNWNAEGNREVWLNGEGFFEVKSTTRQARFLVHAKDLQVEVLGTKFNVKQRSEQTTVVLESGKVQLHVKDAATLVMTPGELVKYTPGTRNTVRKKVNAKIYTSWKTGRLEFENASIREIAGVLEDNYDLKVIFEDTAFQHHQFNGVFPAGNVNVLLEALSKAYQLDISRNGAEVRLGATPSH